MKILILGGCGFVGSNLAIHLKTNYPNYRLTVLDNLQRKGSELNLQRLINNEIAYLHGDIRNFEDLSAVDKVDVIIDASAESSILTGLYDSPRKVINTNLVSTINCLELAREKNARFIFLSSSRIYPIVPLNNAKYEELNTRY